MDWGPVNDATRVASTVRPGGHTSRPPALPVSVLVTLAERQLASLPFVAIPEGPEGADGPERGVEESILSVDTQASIQRAERHALAIARTASAPRYHDRAAWAGFVSDFFDDLGCANFPGAEIVAVHARQTWSGVKNRLPDAWGVLRLALVVIRAQHYRDRVGGLRPTSLCRVPVYNDAIGGAPLGQHPWCTAADLVPLQATVAEFARLVREMRGTRLVLTDRQRRAIAAFRAATGYTGSVLSGPVRGEPYGPGVRYDGASFRSSGGEGVYGTFCHGDLRGYPATWKG